MFKAAIVTHHLCGFGCQGIRSLVHDYVYSLVGLLDGLSILYFDLFLLIASYLIVCLMDNLFDDSYYFVKLVSPCEFSVIL